VYSRRPKIASAAMHTRRVVISVVISVVLVYSRRPKIASAAMHTSPPCSKVLSREHLYGHSCGDYYSLLIYDCTLFICALLHTVDLYFTTHC